MATLVLFYTVDKWNEWFNPMIFIRKQNLQPLQIVLRSIVNDLTANSATAMVETEELVFTFGMKMAAVILTMLPIMLFFPFLQKHFAKGIMVGAIKA
jgi:putative aldouronate transport system permease protein